jgi:dTDP-glucose 4,6-dehydratase
MELKNINLFVTGGCGFIGSHFCNYIYTKVNKLIILDKLTYAGDKKYINNILNNDNVFLIIDDILNHNFIETYNKYDINYIIHLAAETHVDNSYNYFKKYINNNIIATQILVESILNYNKKIKLIHFSTDEIYGESNNDNIIFNENANFNPTNPYAATKASAELIINTYKYSYNLPIIITRCNNVYGINQHNEKVIPKFISNIIDNQPIKIHGKHNKKRDFIYIDDVISALEIIIINGIEKEIYNIGIDNPIYIHELANIICSKMNKKNHKILRVKDRPFNDYRYNIDNSKLMNIGWKPIFINKNDFEKNLEKIIDNIKKN